jgi:hypothetical protein
MADTGPPWDLPYPLSTDLVRNGAAAIQALAEATADGLDDAGAVRQLKAATDSTGRSTTSTSFVDASLSLAFTPTASGSLLVVEFTGAASFIKTAGSAASREGDYRLVEVGGSALSGAESVAFGRTLVATSSASAGSASGIYLRAVVSAGSTSARTYRVEFRSGSADVTNFLNNDGSTGRLTVTEYAAGVL